LFVLHVTRGPDQGRKLSLEPGKTYTIGCNGDASLVLTDPLVLKGHCSLEVSAAGVVLRNHTATAGTFVGDQKVSQATLKPNSTFRIGATVLGIAAAPAAQPKAPPAPPDPLIGRIVGGYKLNELVGAGGMGKVFRATQLSLHRDVAFKVLLDRHVKDKGFRDLFINEARAAAQLIHPNVVQVYDAGTEGDLVYFSMEFLGKGSIEEILEREKRIPWEQAILQVLEAAHGLEYAESKGIVHRDIKPDNLMLNEDGRVKIADLGLAKRGEGDQDAGVIGTPHFIPPEQALGKEVDHRADIYSLGATFFRMITGQTLFTGKTAKEIVLKHIKEPPPAASSVDDTVPDDLDLVIAKMLAKDTAQRYQSATVVIAALEEVCAHHGIKGAIIKKGVGKRVLIPLFLLLLTAGAAVYYLAFLKGEDPEKAALRIAAIAAQKKAEEETRKKQEENERLERENNRREAVNRLQMRENARLEMQIKNPLHEVYKDLEEAPQLESRWFALANEFDDLATSKLAKDFEEELEISSKAQRHADEIRESLKRWKESAEDLREKTAAKVREAKEIDGRVRKLLASLRAERKFEAAVNLCDLVANSKPAKEDPFGPIVTWEWISPDKLLKQSALDFPDIKKVVDESRKYFQGERQPTLDGAKSVADTVTTEASEIPKEADPAAIDAAIKRLDDIRKFRDENGPVVAEIGVLIGAARKEQLRLEGILSERTAKLLGEDRVRVRDLQRLICSLDPEMPNSVMSCDFTKAISQWQQLLAAEKIKTELYRRFAKERIAMLQWCEFLFGRFHVDVLLSAADGNGKPLKLLALDRVPFPGEEMKDVALTAKNAERYKFSLSKPRNRQDVFAYGEFPMDWVYNSVFLHLNEPRWAEMTPDIHFALGAFCFETMQYKDAVRHFDEVVKADDGELGRAARSLRARAELEAKARAAYEALLREYDARTKSADMEALRKKVEAYRNDHEGTIFFLDVVDPTNPADALKIDFHPADAPEVPQAPPPPVP
jgi:hypothetical protein